MADNKLECDCVSRYRGEHDRACKLRQLRRCDYCGASEPEADVSCKDGCGLKGFWCDDCFSAWSDHGMRTWRGIRRKSQELQAKRRKSILGDTPNGC
jgi:hypothetical protein